MKRLALAIVVCFPLVALASPPQILAVDLNGSPTGQTEVFYPDDGLTTSGAVWAKLGVKLPPALQNAPQVSTEAIGATFKIDAGTGAVDIVVPPALLPKQVLGDTPPPPGSLPSPPARVVSLNYNLALAYGSAGQVNGSAYYNLGVPLLGGYVQSSGQVNYQSGQGTQVQRLYTTWERDDYARLIRWQVGDVFTAGMASVDLLGVKFAKSPAVLDPLTPLYPLPVIAGVAMNPGTLEVLTNQALVSQTPVKAGDFTLSHFSSMTGYNPYQVVLTDPYGRQTVLATGGYYFAPTLLRPGLTTWDFTGGLLRQGLTNHYQGLALAGTVAHGFTDWLTVGGQFQASGQGQTLGGNLTAKLGMAGVVAVAANGSRGPQGTGYQFSADYNYTHRTYALDLHYQRQSPQFWQLTDETRFFNFNPSQSLTATFTKSFGAAWRAGLNYSTMDLGSVKSRLVYGNVGFNHGRDNLGLSLGYDLTKHDPNALLTYTHTFARPSISASYGLNNGRTTAQLQASDGFTHGLTNYNFNANLINTTGSRTASLFGMMNSPLGSASLTYSNFGSGSSLAASWSSSVKFYWGGWSMANASQPGFVLVSAPGLAQVGVLINGQPMGKTNGQGQAVVGNLPTLNPVQVALDVKDLPPGSNVEVAEHKAVVPLLGGTQVKFAQSSTQARAFTITHAGQPLPVGSQASSGEYVGYDGLAYFDHPPVGQTITFTDPAGKTCRATFPTILPAYGKPSSVECK